MRTILLIVGGNALAFALGVVIAVWLIAQGPATSSTAASAAAPSLPKPAAQPLGSGPIGAAQAQTTANSTLPVITSGTKPAQPADVITPSAQAAGTTAGPNPQPPSAAPPVPAATEVTLAAVSPTTVAPTGTVPATPSPSPPPPAAPAPAPAVVAAPAAPPSAPPAGRANTAAAPVLAGYVLQLGAFQEAANAARLQAAVRKAGYAADIVPAKSGDKSWQLVRIGGYASRESAATAAASLQRDTGIAALIMRPVLQ